MGKAIIQDLFQNTRERLQEAADEYCLKPNALAETIILYFLDADEETQKRIASKYHKRYAQYLFEKARETDEDEPELKLTSMPEREIEIINGGLMRIGDWVYQIWEPTSDLVRRDFNGLICRTQTGLFITGLDGDVVGHIHAGFKLSNLAERKPVEGEDYPQEDWGPVAVGG